MAVPVFLLLLLGILEFGFVFDQTMTINYATREGARNGSAFANGNATTMPCVTSEDVDKHIVAAVQRILEAPGSRVAVARIDEIRIYNANNAGGQIGGQANIWTPGSGPVVDGVALKFNDTTTNWNACSRDNTWTGTTAPDSIGVGIQYRYEFVTPLAGIAGFFGPSGGTTIVISDRTVMALNPSSD
jgi:Flp pilus assembly protein TadG